MIIWVAIFSAIIGVALLVPKIKNKAMPSQLILYLSLLFWVIALLIHAKYIFPYISQAYGGGQPRLISLITTEQEISYLKILGVKNASNIQTENLCVAYENQDIIVFFLQDRVVGLKRDNIKGYGSLPSVTRDKLLINCSNAAFIWTHNQAEWNPL